MLTFRSLLSELFTGTGGICYDSLLQILDTGDTLSETGLTTICCFGEVESSRAQQDSPLSSRTVRSTIISKLFRIMLMLLSASCSAVLIPIACRRLLSLLPMPHTLSALTSASNLRCRSDLERSTNPFVQVHFLAAKLASLASVLDGPNPTPMVSPSSFFILSRIWRPNLF